MFRHWAVWAVMISSWDVRMRPSAVLTSVTGIGDLLPGVKVDDWAFEPCGYSMNGLRERYYYTIHVTPESGFSYASFETNDPQYREPKWVERIASAFQPTALTLTLTTRRVGCELGAFVLGGYERSGLDTAELGKVKVEALKSEGKVTRVSYSLLE